MPVVSPSTVTAETRRCSVRVPRPLWIGLAAVVGLILLVNRESPFAELVLAADEADQAPSVKRWPEGEKTHRQLEKPTTVEFIDLPLDDCLTYLSEYHNVRFRTDRESLDKAGIALDRPVTMRLTGVSMRNVLNLLLAPVELGFHVERDGLVITTREQAAAHLHQMSCDLGLFARKGISAVDLGGAIVATIAPETWRKKEGRNSLRVEGDVLHMRVNEDVEEQVDLLLAELQRALLDDELEVRRLHTENYPIDDLQNLGVSDAQLLEWLQRFLLGGQRPPPGSGAEARIEKDQLRLKQPAWMHGAATRFFQYLRLFRQHDPARPPTDSEFEMAAGFISADAKWRLSRMRLAQTVTLKLDREPLEDGLLWIRDKSGLQIWVNLAELTAQKIDPQTSITLRAEKEPLPRVLDRVLGPQHLDWYVGEPGVIVVTSLADASRRRELHVYPTKNLLRTGETEGRLVRRIMTSIEPGSWTATGGTGTARIVPGALIVTHHRRVHEEIERLTAELERPGLPRK